MNLTLTRSNKSKFQFPLTLNSNGKNLTNLINLSRKRSFTCPDFKKRFQRNKCKENLICYIGLYCDLSYE